MELCDISKTVCFCSFVSIYRLCRFGSECLNTFTLFIQEKPFYILKGITSTIFNCKIATLIFCTYCAALISSHIQAKSSPVWPRRSRSMNVVMSDIDEHLCRFSNSHSIISTSEYTTGSYITSMLVAFSFSSITCFRMVREDLMASFNVMDWKIKQICLSK